MPSSRGLRNVIVLSNFFIYILVIVKSCFIIFVPIYTRLVVTELKLEWLAADQLYADLGVFFDKEKTTPVNEYLFYVQ